MDLIHVIALALLQGLTEFLPISSSAHLILLPNLVGWDDQGLAFDVAVHLGTLIAVTLYFRQELLLMTRDWVGSVVARRHTEYSRLAWWVLLGTIPVGICGLLFSDLVETYLRSPLVIATTTMVFGLALWWFDVRGRQNRSETGLTWVDVLVIGVAQAIALIPGTSRSGITITAGLMLGLKRQAAARFSFLLAIPVIVLAGGLETLKLVKQDVGVDWLALVLGVVVSAVSAFLCIHFFLRLLDRMSMLPFVVYRLALGALLFAIYV